MYLNIVTAVDIPAAWPVFKPAVDPATLTHKQLLRGDFWRTIPAYADVDEATVPRPHAGRRRHSITHAEQAARDAAGPRSREEFISDAARRLQARAPMSVRVSPYLLSLIDWSEPVRRSAAHPVHPARLAASARSSRSSGSTRCTSRPTRRCPGSPTATPTRRCSSPLDTCPVYCRFCTRSYAVGVDTEEVEKVQLQGRRRALAAARSRTSPRGPSSRTSSSPAATPTTARRADHARSATTLLGDAQHPPHPLRDQGSGGDAAEDPHRRRVARRADARSSSSGRKLHKEVVLHTHFNHPNEITGDHRATR